MEERKKAIKDYIAEKFKNLTRFAIIAGYDATALHNLFRKKDLTELEEVYQVALALDDRPLENELTEDEIEALRGFIQQHHNGSVTDFCRAKGVWLMTVSQMLKQGGRRFKTDPVKDVLRAAGLIEPESEAA